MERIASFSVNHDLLEKGVYISRIDGDVVTYDIRTKVPNKGDYLSNGEMHTFEHLFATYVRNTDYSGSVIYVGPMGCRTGFYFLVRDTISHAQVLAVIKDSCGSSLILPVKFPGANGRNAAIISSMI